MSGHASGTSYCSSCGYPLPQAHDAVDTRSHRACHNCGTVAYSNPHILVTTIVEYEGKVLLCRRAEAPQIGRWNLPGGFMECHESLEEAAVRETREETGLELDPNHLNLHAVASLPGISQVYISFYVRLESPQVPQTGPECSEVGFFSEQTLPWDNLAYPDTAIYLRQLFKELKENRYSIHFGRLEAQSASRNIFRVASIDSTVLVREMSGEKNTGTE